jgi:plasmid stabilization system protein ParE
VTEQTNTGDVSESGTSSTPATKTTPRAPARTSLEEFSELLRDAEGGDDAATGEAEETPDGGGDEPARKPKKPKSLGDVAEGLGVKESELYSIEIPSSRAGEKPFTLGALKDLMKQRDDFAMASLKLDEDRRSHEREKVIAEEELREVLNLLPAEALSDKAMKKLREGLDAKRAKARAGIVEQIPEWKDPTVRESDLKGITEHLKGYGIRESFLLANLDGGVLRFLRDSVKRAETVRKALEAVEERRAKTPNTGKKAGKTEPAKRASGDRVEGEVQAFRQAFKDYAARKH